MAALVDGINWVYLGAYPGTPDYSNAGQRSTIEVWFGKQPHRIAAQEIDLPWFKLYQWAFGWPRPMWAFAERG